MLATVGLVVPEFVRVPGAQFSFDAVPNVLDAHDALLDTSMKQILLWVSFAEVCTLAALSNMNEFDRVPGDYGFDPLGAYPTDPAKQEEMKLKELKNGRLVSFLHGFYISDSSCSFIHQISPEGLCIISHDTGDEPPIPNMKTKKNRQWSQSAAWSSDPPLRDTDSRTYKNIIGVPLFFSPPPPLSLPRNI
jgi:hypothetical protein